MLRVCRTPLICFKDKDALSRSQSQPVSASKALGSVREQVGSRTTGSSLQLLGTQAAPLGGVKESQEVPRYPSNSVKHWDMETRDRNKPGRS